MPATLFRAAMKRAPDGLDGVLHLAQAFNMSLTATAIRLVTLTDLPVAIIMSKGDRILWSRLSDELKEFPGVTRPERNAPIPMRSATFAFNQDPENVQHNHRIESEGGASDWLGAPSNLDCVEEVFGLGKV